MRRKLIISGFSMVAIIILIVAGNQLIIKLFANFSQKLITEYHELHSLQELKVSLSKAVTYLNLPDEHSEPGFHSKMEAAMEESFDKMEVCATVLTHQHKKKLWMATRAEFSSLEDYTNQVGPADEAEEEVLLGQIKSSVEKVIQNIDEMVNETLVEINEYEVRNRKVVQHGTLTVLVFGLSLILFMALAGLGFIRKLTRPIDQLVSAMKKISKGKTDLRVEVDSDDEFLFLADSFNNMLEELNTTTVSKEFFSKILNNLYGAVVVTDDKGKISFINESACKLLECKAKELSGKDSTSLFNVISKSGTANSENFNIQKYASQLRKMTEMRKSDGSLIPVYTSCTILKDPDGQANGMVIVSRDLTDEKAIEEKLERIRKERLIAINEAEENERMRIAKDLHDGLGQILTGISYSVQNIKKESDSEREIIDGIHSQISSAIQEAKNISHNLTPVILKDFGLVVALNNLVGKINQLNKTEIIFNAYDFEQRIDTRLEKAIFRIIQEALHNIIKHSEAKTATVELFREYRQIALVIEDNGVGFNESEIDYDEGQSGIGLISMKERVNVFDGTINIHSESGRGTEIVIEIPCRSNITTDG